MAGITNDEHRQPGRSADRLSRRWIDRWRWGRSIGGWLGAIALTVGIWAGGVPQGAAWAAAIDPPPNETLADRPIPTAAAAPTATPTEAPTATPTSIKPYLDRVKQRVTEFTLRNGMKFIVLERHQAPVVSFMTYANVG
ncbi:MAG TPA: hypothetical protein V6D46_00230, partial [Coleofasciculaceae cyanobacterium]